MKIYLKVIFKTNDDGCRILSPGRVSTVTTKIQLDTTGNGAATAETEYDLFHLFHFLLVLF